MHIYKTTNLINGKIYIGQTSKNNENYFGSGSIILKSIKKYGANNFSKETIEECDSKEKLNEKEIYWIKFFNSTNKKIGYNISNGGDGGNLGVVVNKKISKSLKNSEWMIEHTKLMKGNDYRKGKQAPNKGISMTEEQKIKISKSKIGKNGKKIICINNNIVYNTIGEAAKILNLHKPNIIAVLKGRYKQTKGYVFEYI